MTSEIYITVIKGKTRLVITGELALLREFIASLEKLPKCSNQTIQLSPAPKTGEVLTQGVQA